MPPASSKTLALSAQAQARFDRALMLQRFGEYEEAQRQARQVLRAHPGHGPTLQLLAALACQLGQPQQGLQLIEAALAGDPSNAAAHANHARILADLGEFARALAALDRGLKLRPGHAESYAHRGLALKHLGRLDEALQSLDHALALQPDLALAQLNRAFLLLLMGDFERGWPAYESRLSFLPAIDPGRYRYRPAWRGEALAPGQTLLLSSEQGLGDTLQFCRFAPLVATAGARIVLECPRPLLPLLSALPGVDALAPTDETLPDFDLRCPLLSLPLVLQLHPDRSPAPWPYLAADAGRLERWRERLGPKRGLRVGLVWRSGVGLKRQDDRSSDLALWLSQLPAPDEGVEYVALQKEPRPEDLQVLARHPQVRVCGPELNDFADTAAVCELMDVVVSVDTSVAHLAGAMGRPLQVLLPLVPEWRWLLDRPDSPWYPSARLHRQTVRADWAAPLQAVAADLRARLAA